MRISSALLAVTCALAGCVAPESEGASAGEVREDTSGIRDSIAGTAAASLNEHRTLGLLEHSHAADSAMGALGAQHGSTLEIKEFGRMMMREHIALRREAAAVARGLNIASEPPRVAPARAPDLMREALLATPLGGGWDRAYVEYALAAHEASMENTARALAATQDSAVKEYIRQSVPILQKHADKARSLRQSLAKAASPPPATP
ncbi:MAG: DUF4142 domain-containing protein [Gemmatimonadaceae bacterium]